MILTVIRNIGDEHQDKANERVKIFAEYFPELFLLIYSLDNYSICVRHYNQIITSNFLEKLKV